MTIEEFNALNLNSGDVIEITYMTGETVSAILYQGRAYAGAPETRTYPNNQLVPAIPSQILIFGISITNVRGIELELVDSVREIGHYPALA